MQEIRISTLPMVTSPEQFFEIDKIVFVDVLELDPVFKKTPTKLHQEFKNHVNTFIVGEKYYRFIVLTGSPENLYKNGEYGFKLSLSKNYELRYFWGKQLPEVIEARQLYDFSEWYPMYKAMGMRFAMEGHWLVDLFQIK